MCLDSLGPSYYLIITVIMNYYYYKLFHSIPERVKQSILCIILFKKTANIKKQALAKVL